MVFYLCKLRLPADWKGKIPQNPALSQWKRYTPNLIFILDHLYGELIFAQHSRYPERADAEFRAYCESNGVPNVPYDRTEVTTGELIEAMRTGRLMDNKETMGKIGPLAFLKDISETVYYEWIADVQRYSNHRVRCSKARQSRCPGLIEELEDIQSKERKKRSAYALMATERTGRNRAELLVAAWHEKGWNRSGRVCVIRPQPRTTDLRRLCTLYRFARDGTMMVLLDKITSVDKDTLLGLGALTEQFTSTVLTLFVVTAQSQHLLADIEKVMSSVRLCRIGWGNTDDEPEQESPELISSSARAKTLEALAKKAPQSPEIKTSKAMQELDNMIGLENVKAKVHQIVDFCRARQIYEAHGFKPHKVGLHMVFYGNPGTAKTTVARLVAQIFKDYGILEKGKLFECGRTDLVGKWSGWSASQTRELVKKANQSILFLDEAYSLVAEEGEDHFGREALDTLVQEMENHRHDMVVILAGYKQPMKRLLEQNAGLASRISWHIDFEDYTEDNLIQIFWKILEENERCIRSEDEKVVRSILREGMKRNDSFGNGRYVRTLVENGLLAQASRLMLRNPEEITDDDIRYLNAEDLADPMPAEKSEQMKVPEPPPKRLIGFLR